MPTRTRQVPKDSPGRTERAAALRPFDADAVAGRRTEDLSRHVFNSLSDQLAVLDRTGTILSTNARWNELQAVGQGGPAGLAPRGTNYLEVLARDAALRPAAARARRGISDILAGRIPRFRLEYAARCSEDRRWHIMQVLPLRRAAGGAVVLCSDATRQRAAQRQVRALSRMLLAAQEKERRTVARELHDDITQQIAAAAINLSVLIARIPDSAQDLRADATRIASGLRSLSTHVHALSRRMHPHALETLGLARAVEAECRSFAERTGIGMTTNMTDTEPLPPRVALAAFRICQESLQNVARHARATSIRVDVIRSGSDLQLSVKDSGVGFNVRGLHRGLGLAGMRERALAVGGRISVTSGFKRGTTVKLTIPLAEDANI